MALILVLLLTVLLSVAGTSLLLMVDMETKMVANHRDAMHVVHAAEGAAEFAAQELSRIGDWTAVLNGSLASRLMGPSVLPPLLGRASIDLPGLTGTVQQAEYGAAWWGADTPQWRVFGHGVPAHDIPIAGLPADSYSIIWVSDDIGETDGDPSTDTNQTVVVRARAFGPRDARADVQAVLERVGPGVVRRVSSRVVR